MTPATVIRTAATLAALTAVIFHKVKDRDPK